MKCLSKILILSLAITAFSCKSNPRSETQSVSESTAKDKEAQLVQEQVAQESSSSNVSQN